MRRCAVSGNRVLACLSLGRNGNAFGSSCFFTCNLQDLGFVYGRNARNGAPSIFDQEVLGSIGPYQLERPQPGGCLTCGGGPEKLPWF